MGLKESKHLFVIQPLTPLSLPHVPSPFPPLLLHHALLSNESSQDACTDGPAAACYPSGSCWHGRLLGPLPIIPSLNRSPKSVLASKLNAEVQGPSQSGCWATWWLPGAADTKETAHMSPCTRCNRMKLAHYCWFMVCLCLGRSEAENKWVHCVLTKKQKKTTHACTLAPTQQPNTGLNYRPGIPAPHPFPRLSLWYELDRGWELLSWLNRDTLPKSLLLESPFSVWSGVMLTFWHLFHTHQLRQP